MIKMVMILDLGWKKDLLFPILMAFRKNLVSGLLNCISKVRKALLPHCVVGLREGTSNILMPVLFVSYRDVKHPKSYLCCL